MSNLILAVTVTCAAGSTAATIAGNPMKGDGLAPTVTEGAWLIVTMGGGIFAQVPVAADATADNALTLLHPLPAAVTGAAGWVAVDPDKDSVAIATMQAVQAIRARFTPASVWFTGNGPPSSDIGVDGDLYRDYDESPPIEYRRDNGIWGISPAATVLPWNARGDWAAGSTYAKQDLVTYNGSSWLSRVDANTGNAPTTAAAQWQLVARSGDQILMAAGAPAAGLGVDGAAYINTSNGDLYKKSAGAWGAPQGNIKGPQGNPGPANTLAIGTVSTGPAAATITGASPNQTLNLTVPKGDTGPANTLAIGTVASGVSAGATITGTAPNQTLNLTLPKGDTGNTGPAGIAWKGAWSSATAYVVNDAVTSGGSSYRCKVSHTNQAVTNATYWELIAQKGTDGTGAGDVVGPAGGVADGGVAVFNGTTGKVIKGDPTFARWNDGGITIELSKAYAGSLYGASITNTDTGDNSQGMLQLRTGRSGSFVRLSTINYPAATSTTLVFGQLSVGTNLDRMVYAAPIHEFYAGAGVLATRLNGTGLNVPSGMSYQFNGAQLGYGNGLAGFGTAASKNTGTTAGQVPILDGAGKLDVAVLPAVAITDTFVVSTQAAMLALTAQRGDVCIRTDLNKCFILQTDSPSTLADWKELLTPTDAVLSVAGLTGAITAAALRGALTLAPVATSGAYADLTGKPALGTAAAANTADFEKAGEQVGINTQTGTAYTLVLADKGKIVEMNNAGANTLTIPANASVAFPVNSRIDLSQFGAGQTTIAADAGVTIRSAGGKLKLTGQYSGATLYKRGTDEWVLVGDLAA